MASDGLRSTLPRAPNSCLYVILLDDDPYGLLDQQESPFSRVDTGLIASVPALFAISSLPVYIEELRAKRHLWDVGGPALAKHAVLFTHVSTCQAVKTIVELYPYVVCFDYARVEVEWPAWPGHLRIRGHEVDTDPILATWCQDGMAAVARVEPFWPKWIIEPLARFAADLQRNGVYPAKMPALPSSAQAFTTPNARLRNRARGYWGNAIFTESSLPIIPPKDVKAVQHRQCELADSLLDSLRRPARQAIVCMPSIAPIVVSSIVGRMKASGHHTLAKALTDTPSYQYEINPQEMQDKEGFLEVGTTIQMRGSEIAFYDAAAACRAAPACDPVFRTPQVPSIMRNRLDDLAKMTWTHRTIARSMNRWDRLSEDLTTHVGTELLEWLVRHSSGVAAITDMPIEWCRVKGIPLSYLLPISRVPMGPGNSPIRPIVDLRPPAIWERLSDISVLVANGHGAEDHLRTRPPALARIVADLGFPTVYCDVSGEEELFAALEKHNPKILYLSMHGTWSRTLGSGLAFENGASALAVHKLPASPDVAIISSCRSSAIGQTYTNPVANLYGAGVRTVLGTYLPVTEPHATTIMAGLFVNIKAVFTREFRKLRDWRTLCWKTLNMRRPLDFLIAAHGWMDRRKQDPAAILELFTGYVEVHNREKRPIAETWDLVPERLVSIARGTPYEEAIIAVTRQHAVRPESLFYTQVGEPETILFAPGAKETKGKEVR